MQVVSKLYLETTILGNEITGYSIQTKNGEVTLCGDTASTLEDAFGLFLGLLFLHFPTYVKTYEEVLNSKMGFTETQSDSADTLVFLFARTVEGTHGRFVGLWKL